MPSWPGGLREKYGRSGQLDILTVFGIAVGLSMDAFAVAIASSVSLGKVKPRQVASLAASFGIFQAVMPVVGWLAGLSLERWIRAWDHWVALALLAFVGGKAIITALFEGEEERRRSSDPTRGVTLLVLSVATSVDALAVGMSFAALRVTIWFPVAVIGLVCAAFTAAGMLAGCRLGAGFGRKMEVAGGLVLIGIGLKILVEHL